MLEKCGSFGYYQMAMFGLFGVINMLSSIHYYSQTIINFVPDHWYVFEWKFNFFFCGNCVDFSFNCSVIS